MDSNDILHGLNAAQRTAVASPSSVLQVLAPPGSGKTKTLTARVAHLIAHRQLLPWNIIVCTFTVKAANEMKERIKNFVGHDLSKKLNLGTFHSVSLRFLRAYGQHIGLPNDFGIADSADSKAILKRIIKKHGISMEPGQALGRISSRKAKGHVDAKPERAPKTVEQQEFQLVFDAYEAALAASNLLDYDDILLRCCFLLKTRPDCVKHVQAVLIDEFQDTNNIQYDLMSLFAQKLNVITIVGDPDQSIYGFRSAEIKNLARMKTHWPDTLTINLEENYRSSGAILHAAQNIIEQDENRPPKKLQATHTFGLRPVLRKLPSAAAEAEWLVSEIKRMETLSGNMMQHGDFAILLRSAALSRAIETALGNAGVPYRMVGGMRFYDRAEVKLVVDYLRVIHQPENSEALERVINLPARKVGDETVKKLREEAQNKNLPLWHYILDITQGRRTPKTNLTEPTRKGLASFVNVILSGRKKMETWDAEQPSLVDLINLIAQKISLQQYLKSKHSDDETYEARWSNVEELMAQAADIMLPGRLDELLEADALPEIEDLQQRTPDVKDVLSVFLANIALTASAEKQAEEDGEKVQQITISTIHAAKGLEWPVVFIPACYDSSIPHSRADDHDEERRLLYVGMTRAQALLYLSCPIKNTQREETSLSTFLTHSGTSRYFEEHGPSLPITAVTSLAITLKRDCPTHESIVELKETLERDEDNYFPLNGEEVFQESGEWISNAAHTTFQGFGTARATTWAQSTSTTMQQGFSMASATVQPGFKSVAAQYDELMEQAKIRNIEKRAEVREQPAQLPKGRKRQIEGQANIASFFGKKPKAADETERLPPQQATKPPLRDVSNSADRPTTTGFVSAKANLPTHKPRSTPMIGRPLTTRDTEEPVVNNKYIFLSSSPTKPENEGQENRPVEPEPEETGPPPTMRPATTFHTTSMAKAAPQRKTLGMRRSLQGCNAARKK